MRTLAQLMVLDRSLRGRHVLTVYLHGTSTDPSKQRVWRLQLEHCLRDLRKWLAGSPYAEREELEQCVRLLNDELSVFTGNVGAPGFAAFITAERVHEVMLLPMPIPTQAIWSTGMSIAPYLRALKETRRVAIALVDSTRADVHQYDSGVLKPVESVRAHHTVMTPSHMGDAPKPGFRSGTRGQTGHDEAQRSLLEGTNRMVARTADLLVRVAGRDGWIVTGGIPKVSEQLAKQLSSRAPGRVLHLESLDIHASTSQILDAARAAASTLRNAMDATRLAEIVDLGEGHSLRGALGPAATRAALEQSNVRELYMTPRYLQHHAADAEDAVRSAIGQRATVEEVSGAAAVQLDAHGGLAARLRYPVVAAREPTP